MVFASEEMPHFAAMANGVWDELVFPDTFLRSKDTLRWKEAIHSLEKGWDCGNISLGSYSFQFSALTFAHLYRVDLGRYWNDSMGFPFEKKMWLKVRDREHTGLQMAWQHHLQPQLQDCEGSCVCPPSTPATYLGFTWVPVTELPVWNKPFPRSKKSFFISTCSIDVVYPEVIRASRLLTNCS